MTTPRQTNLYNPAFRPPRELVTLSRLMQAAVLLAGGAIALGSWMSWQLHERENRSAELAAQIAAAQARLRLEEPVQAAREQRAAAELAALQRHEQVLRRILEAAGGIDGPQPEPGHKPAHSQVLEALARASQPGLWLTGVELSDGAGALTLRGHMLDAAALPRYISRLNAEPRLSGLRFDQLEVKATPSSTAPNLLGFVLQAAPASNAKGRTR